MSQRVVTRRKLKKVAVGDLRERISLERRVTKAPQFNSSNFSETLTQIAEVWASVDTRDTYPFISQSRRKDYNGVDIGKDDSTHSFRIRFRADISSEDTVIRYNDELYHITEITDPDERRMYLFLSAKLMGDDDKEANQ